MRPHDAIRQEEWFQREIDALIEADRFQREIDALIEADHAHARAENDAHSRPISTLLPIGLPPVSVQEIEALRSSPLEALRDAIDQAFDAFLERDRATLAELLRWVCETCRSEREWAGRSGEHYAAAVLLFWRLYRETPL